MLSGSCYLELETGGAGQPGKVEGAEDWDDEGNWIGEPAVPKPESGEEEWYENGTLDEFQEGLDEKPKEEATDMQEVWDEEPQETEEVQDDEAWDEVQEEDEVWDEKP